MKLKITRPLLKKQTLKVVRTVVGWVTELQVIIFTIGRFYFLYLDV